MLNAHKQSSPLSGLWRVVSFDWQIQSDNQTEADRNERSRLRQTLFRFPWASIHGTEI